MSSRPISDARLGAELKANRHSPLLCRLELESVLRAKDLGQILITGGPIRSEGEKRKGKIDWCDRAFFRD